MVFEWFRLLVVEMRERLKPRIRLPGSGPVGPYRKQVVVYRRRIGDPVDRITGILVTDLGVDRVIGTHLPFPGRPPSRRLAD